MSKSTEFQSRTTLKLPFYKKLIHAFMQTTRYFLNLTKVIESNVFIVPKCLHLPLTMWQNVLWRFLLPLLIAFLSVVKFFKKLRGFMSILKG